MEIQVTRLVLMVVVVLPQLFQQSGAQLPGIAIHINSVGEEEGQFINENGGTAVICLTKRSGSVPGDGLTVDLLLTFPAQAPRAVINSDYTVTDGGTVHFSPGAADGEERCVTITAICDGVSEENETIVVILTNGQGYETNTTGLEFTGFVVVIIVESTGPPLSPHVDFNIKSHSVENSTICLTWQRQKSDLYYLINTGSAMEYNETSTELCLTAEYNTPLQVSVVAVNCAGESEPMTTDITIPGCGPPSPPVNGSVGEWTSSRVGAQVTYSCDTHLVLVGETVATCSLPSLTWLPSSDDVMCVLPSTPSVSVTLPTTNKDGKKSSSAALSTAEAVVTTGVVCVVCSFTAGLLLGVLLTQCHGHCHRKGKRSQTEIPPVYEDIPLEKTPPIELNTNEAYGHISHN